MSNKSLTGFLKVCSVLPAFAICGIAVSADAAGTQWSGNTIAKTDEAVTGGAKNVGKNEKINEIDVDSGISNNSVVIRKDAAGVGSDVYGQGAGLYVTGTIGEIDADFVGNSILTQSDQAGKATANGGAVAIYQGGKIGVIDGDFTRNSVTAEYTGEGDTSYSGSSVISAGGGAIHIEGKWGGDAADAKKWTEIGLIDGDFVGNSATGDGYANGGAIYVKAGPKTSVEIGRINGDFVNNRVEAKTADASVKATTGGAISLKIDKSDSADMQGQIMVDGDFIGNMATTNATDALGGAVYNEATFISGGNYMNNKAESKTGNAFGGAIYNKGRATVYNTLMSGNSASQGGAVYNDTGAVFVLQGNNTFRNNKAGDVANDIYNLGTFVIRGGTTNFGGGIDGTGRLEIEDDALVNLGTNSLTQGVMQLDGTLAMSIVDGDSFGTLKVDDITVGETGKLALSIKSAGEYKLFLGDTIDAAHISAGGGIYNMTDKGSGTYEFTLKSANQISQDTGLSGNASNTLAILTGSTNDKATTISMAAQQALAADQVGRVEEELGNTMPTDQPVAQSVSTAVQGQILSLASARMSGVANVGRSGGDESATKYGAWVQGLFNKSKLSGQFHGYTRGIALGFDARVAHDYTLGIGYAYNSTDVHANARDTDVESNTLFLYGQYKPNQWYVNAMLNYTMSGYEENARVFGVALDSDYDVDTYGGQIMTGYDMAFGLTPEVGVRYMHITQDSYNNGLADIDAQDTDFLTGVAGAKYSFMIENGTDVLWHPSIRAAVTYDFISDGAQATVMVPGATPYIIAGDSLSRLGGEVGVGLTAQYKGLEVSLNYELDMHKDFTSQTGMLQFRYDF